MLSGVAAPRFHQFWAEIYTDAASLEGIAKVNATRLPTEKKLNEKVQMVCKLAQLRQKIDKAVRHDKYVATTSNWLA